MRLAILITLVCALSVLRAAEPVSEQELLAKLIKGEVTVDALDLNPAWTPRKLATLAETASYQKEGRKIACALCRAVILRHTGEFTDERGGVRDENKTKAVETLKFTADILRRLEEYESLALVYGLLSRTHLALHPEGFDPNACEYRFLEADALWAMKNYAACIPLLESAEREGCAQISTLHPAAKINLVLGVAYAQTGQLEKAKKRLERAKAESKDQKNQELIVQYLEYVKQAQEKQVEKQIEKQIEKQKEKQVVKQVETQSGGGKASREKP